ncbi:MAG: hypothetical protein KDA75_16580, partial [Planctomycetaceae bacterium]|nr:hypothetical protein [Planctomycetaceae bacterium]
TLTTGTEANLLKFKELLGILSPEEQSRWDDICRTFKQNVKLRGLGSDDKVGQVIASIGSLSDGLDSIRKAVTSATSDLAGKPSPVEATVESASQSLSAQLQTLADRLEAGLANVGKLAERPIQVDLPPLSIPPLEMKWPETLPVAPAAPPAHGVQGSVGNGDEESSGQSDTSSLPDRITVVNRLPKTIYNVLEHQFNLMQGWLKPIAEMAIAQQGEIKQLRPMVEECLKHYRLLLSKLEEAHEREGE